MFGPGDNSGLQRSAVFAGLLLGCALPLAAEQELPEGIPVGRWVIAPQAFAEFETDDNLLRDTGDTVDKNWENTAEAGAAVAATLPFRDSFFRVALEAADLVHSSVDFSRHTTTRGETKLDLGFSTGDRLAFGGRFTRDYVRVRDEIDEETTIDAEDIFFGEPFDEHQFDVELERLIPGRQGYRIRIDRRDYNYKGESQLAIYNYRGFDSAYEYRQPTSNRGWLIFNYGTRRFNHYRPEDNVGVPFRKEEQDSLQAGWRGQLGPDSPFLFRLGYETLRYKIEPSSYHGLSAYYAGSFRIGGSSRVELSLNRQSLPSTQETYYITNVLRAEVNRDLLRTLELRGRVRFALNDYGGSVRPGCGGEVREDRLFGLDTELFWPVRPRLNFGISGSHERRSSNCDFANYDDTELRAGLNLGWF